jgi:hypothetical protein
MARRYTGGLISATPQATDANSANGIFTLADAQERTALGEFPVGRWTPQRSLRFRRSATAYLSRTPADAPTSRTTYTISTWFKIGSVGTQIAIWGTSDNWEGARITSDGTMAIVAPGGTTWFTSAVFRDPNAWYHMVQVADTTNPIATERQKLYINGVRITSFGTQTAITQNSTTTQWGVSGSATNRIGTGGGSGVGNPFDGYMTEFNYVDGQILDPYAFGFTDPETGTWVPKRYTGTYGTNGFYLPFRNQITSTSFAGSFNGSNQSLSVPQNAAFSFGTGDFTVEAWVYANSWNSVNPIIALGDGAVGGGSPVYSGWVMRYDSSGGIIWYRNAAAGETSVSSGATLPAGQWNHIAISRASGTLRMFANGIQVYSAANSTNYDAINSNTLKIGGNWVIGGGVVTWVNGLISNVRIVKGTGLYTGKFTPTTSPLTAVSGTSLLTLQNSSIVDNSTNAFTITNNNSVTISSQSPFNIPALAADESGNINNWFPFNLSVTAGVTNDSMVDVPGIASPSSLPDVGGVQRGNYPVMSSADNFASATVSNAGLTVVTTNPGNDRHIGCSMAFPSTGKWYWENTVSISDASDARNGMVLMESESFDLLGADTTPNVQIACQNTAVNVNNGAINNANINEAIRTGGGGTVCFAYDADEGKLWIRKNSAISTGFTPNVLNLYNPRGALRFRIAEYSGSISGTNHLNFGQRPFAYTPPAGFKSLCTTNLPNPVIRRPENHFDVKTYTGNNTSLMVGNTQRQQEALRISKSLRFSNTRRTFLERTYGTPTNANIWTLSTWFKPPGAGASQTLQFLAPRYTGNGAGADNDIGHPYIGLAGLGAIYAGLWDSDSNLWQYFVNDTTHFKDSNKWYHFTFTYDSTQVAAANRLKMYIDGILIPASTYTAPTQNTGAGYNNNIRHLIGARYYYTDAPSSNGYLAEWRFIDGQALDPTNFGQYDANNLWVPKQYTGTYGNNGSYLNFSDDRNATTIGYDSTGNNNHWTSYHHTIVSPSVVSYVDPGTYTWTAPTGVTSVNYLVVGGGGGGGDGVPTRTTGGGGGAGGMLTGTLSVTPGTSYTVTIGAGGASGTSPANGGNSVFSSITALGGGNGAYGGQNGAVGGNGGSGGGSSGPFAGGTFAGGLGTSGQGNNGGSASQYTGSGGGGAGAVGGAGNAGAVGGIGAVSNITGVNAYYAGGGAGGGAGGVEGGWGYTRGGLGGGGGCMAGAGIGRGGSNGTNGLGGGGGGGSNPGTTSGTGGSGCVILSYAGMPTNRSTSSSMDNVTDTPSDWGGDELDTGAEVRGNYATIDPSSSSVANLSYLEANTRVTYTSTADFPNIFLNLQPLSGKYYYEFTPTRIASQIVTVVQTLIGGTGSEAGYYNNGNKIGSAYGASYAANDVIGVALDVDAGIVTFYKNNVSQGVQRIFPGPVRLFIQPNNSDFNINCGQRPFVYEPPAGFKSINTKNLKDSGSFNLPDTFGNFVNGPDLAWIKVRSTSGNHSLFDTVRGPRQHLSPSLTAASQTPTVGTGLISFNPNGITLGSDIGGVTGGETNGNGFSLVSWFWNRGKIPGFDIVNYAGNDAANQSIAHNLGTTPKMMIVKSTTAGVASWNSWNVWHANLSNSAQSYLRLNEQATQNTSSAVWGNAAPGNSTFSVGNNAGAGLNGSGDAFIAYLWAEVPGFSSFGSYTGNGSTDGPFIYTGFRPRWIMIKRTDATNQWSIWDTVRNTFNPATSNLWADTNEAETTADGYAVDITSNGFKLRNSHAGRNASSGAYVYAAFAEAPFKYANAR